MNYLRVSTQTGLTDSDVLDIRTAHDNGKSLNTLADYYSVGKSTIGDIVARKTWGHVPDPCNVKGLSGYLVYPDGRVYSQKYKKFLKTRLTKTSVVVEVTSNGKNKVLEVAPLVAQAFHQASLKSKVTFTDGNQYNVHVTNIKV